MDLTERFEWRGREIAWGRAGDGPAVVLCHGTPWSSSVWNPFATTLSRDFTVHLWDMPGYGLSSKHADHAVDLGVQADALSALVEHWGLARPQVVAHDIGGAVSLRAHLVGGVAYSSLLLVDVVAIPPSGSPFFRFVQENPTLLGELPGYIHTAIVQAYIRNASHRGLREDDLAALTRPWTGDDGQRAFYRQIADYDETFLEENERLLGDLRVPVRILWGREDTWIPAALAGKLQRLIAGSTLSLIDGAGHLVQYDAPAALADEVRAWLDRNTIR